MLLTALLHFLNKLFLRTLWVQLQESLTEACREGRRRLGYTRSVPASFAVKSPTGSSTVSARVSELKNRREHAECVSRQEYNILFASGAAETGRTMFSIWSMGYCVLCNALVVKINLAVLIESYVLQRASRLIAL